VIRERSERKKKFVPHISKSGGTIFSLLGALYSPIDNSTVNVKQEAQLSPRDRAMRLVS